MTRQHRTLKVQFEKGATREETLLGRTYLVAPVIAMVEGVRFGAGQTMPELGLASEFGELPIAWANRPLVLNHPQVDGTFVSANTPDILNTYCFGMTMNPQVKDGKLHLEAWIDIEYIQTLGGDFEDAYDRIVAQEDVEVSVGFFSDIEEKKGKFKGQTYGAIWRNIKPDHLAILSEGTLGACSVADGCGVPRINKDGKVILMAKDELKTSTKSEPEPKTQCSCGGAHTQEEHTEGDDEPVTQGGLKKMLADLLKPFTSTKEEKALDAHTAQRAINEAVVLSLQSIDPALMDRDVRNLISRALSKSYGNYTYLMGFNQDVAVYENYNSGSGSYSCYQIGIQVTDTECKFVGEPSEVILQTKIVPQADIAVEEGDETSAAVNTQENDMTDDKIVPKVTKTQAEIEKDAADKAAAELATQSEKAITAQEYISKAPIEIQEALNSALKMQNDAKAKAIKTLTDAKTKFTDDYLKGQTLEVLENMVDMLPGTYKGVAAATVLQFNTDPSNDGKTVPVVKAFTRKTA